MFFNGARCDIYIGKGAGRMLLEDIGRATKSIKIVSPYLSPHLIKELIAIKNRNIEVQLITTDNIEDFYGDYEKNIHKLIIQNREIDKEAEHLRNKWINITEILLYVGLGLIAIEIGLAYLLKDLKVIFGLIPIAVIFFIYILYKRKIRNKRIYNYWYSQLFPFRVYMSPKKTSESNTFIHGKIYLIDNEIAYLGSLNFTKSGTKSNYETRIKITDKEAVEKVKEEFYRLFNHSHLPEKSIEEWGWQLYEEPIN